MAWKNIYKETKKAAVRQGFVNDINHIASY